MGRHPKKSGLASEVIKLEAEKVAGLKMMSLLVGAAALGLAFVLSFFFTGSDFGAMKRFFLSYTTAFG